MAEFFQNLDWEKEKKSQESTLDADTHFSSRVILVSSELGEANGSTIGNQEGIPVRWLKFFKS